MKREHVGSWQLGMQECVGSKGTWHTGRTYGNENKVVSEVRELGTPVGGTETRKKLMSEVRELGMSCNGKMPGGVFNKNTMGDGTAVSRLNERRPA